MCTHDKLTDLGDGLYGCLDCGWFDNAGTPGKRALIVQPGIEADHPGESWQTDDDAPPADSIRWFAPFM